MVNESIEAKERETEIKSEFKKLGQTITSLSTYVDILDDKLKPVKTFKPMGMAEPDKEPKLCDLALEINTNRARIENIISKVVCNIEDLEL